MNGCFQDLLNGVDGGKKKVSFLGHTYPFLLDLIYMLNNSIGSMAHTDLRGAWNKMTNQNIFIKDKKGVL